MRSGHIVTACFFLLGRGKRDRTTRSERADPITADAKVPRKVNLNDAWPQK